MPLAVYIDPVNMYHVQLMTIAPLVLIMIIVYKMYSRYSTYFASCQYNMIS